jgi:vancomycin resistance protein VanW
VGAVAETPRPRRRRRWRLALGQEYYTLRRRLEWWRSPDRLGRLGTLEPGFEQVRHSTPMLRQLKDVDMALQRNKAVNLALASARLDGLVLQPGEVFSYWRLIKRPTRRRGYRKGMVLASGAVRSGMGGGLCQLSNLIYWMTIHTPLTVVERHRHNYDVFPDVDRVIPFGAGATCFYNYGDLVIRNDTDRPYQLRVGVEGDRLAGRWLATAPPPLTYEVYEKAHLMRAELWGGHTRHNVLFRRVFDAAGAQIGDEFVVENHAVMMYAPLLPPGPAR